MHITEKDWKNYIKLLSAVNQKAADVMKQYVEKHGFDDIAGMEDYAYAIVQKYGEASGALSAEMYDAIAEIQNANVPPAEIAPTPTMDEVQKTIRGVTKKSKNVNMVANSVGRLVKRTGADTTLLNAKRDHAQFAWVPSGDTCPFCIMLASRGWQNISKDAMRNGHAEHIHANCDCTYAVRFDEKSYVEGYDPQKYLDMYYGDSIDPDIIEAVDDKWGYGDESSRLMAIRRQLYRENKDKINAQKRAAYRAKVNSEKFTKDGETAIIKSEGSMKYLGQPIRDTDNKSIREWYVANVADIPNRIDNAGTPEEKARQAFELRNKLKHDARVAMSDEETAAKLERVRPALTWEELIRDKMKRKGLTRDEAIQDIYKTASKTNENVNREFGL